MKAYYTVFEDGAKMTGNSVDELVERGSSFRRMGLQQITRRAVCITSATILVLGNRHPIPVVENRGKQLLPHNDQTLSRQAAAARAMTWDGPPIVNLAIEAELAKTGFVREDLSMNLCRRHA